MMNAIQSNLRIILFAAVATLLSVTAWSQDYLHQVIVLNEGWSNWKTGAIMDPATIGKYDPATQLYETVDVIEESGFVSDAIVHAGNLYVAAEGQLLRYDLDNFELLASSPLMGARHLAILGDLLYVTRGAADALGANLLLNSYLQWFDAETLMFEGELVASSEGPAFAAEGIAVVNGKLLVAINNAFDYGNEVGLVGMYDPISGEYDEWNLGDEGINPVHLLSDENNIYTINNRDYSSTSLSSINLGEATVNTYVVAETNAGCLAAVLDDTKILYQVWGEGQVRVSDLNDLEVAQTWFSDTPDYYGMAIDPISGTLYGSVTDYVSFGLVQIRDVEGVLLSTFDCGVSPGVLVMDVRNASGVVSISSESFSEVTQVLDVAGRALPLEAGGLRVELDEHGVSRVRWVMNRQ